MRERVRAVLDQTAWNISQAAALLGITRNTLRARMERFGLRRDGPGHAPPAAPTPVAEPARDSEAVIPSREANLAPPSPSFRWERRLITVFGAVLAGPEDASPLQFAPALGQLIAKLRIFGARVEEISPNRVVAVFGFDPVEDGPRRAAHAALAMLKALEASTAARSRP